MANWLPSKLYVIILCKLASDEDVTEQDGRICCNLNEERKMCVS